MGNVTVRRRDRRIDTCLPCPRVEPRRV